MTSGCLKYLIFTCKEIFKKPCANPNFGVKKMGSHQSHSNAWHKFSMVITWRAQMLSAWEIYLLKALTEDILVLKYPHCLFWTNVPQSFCLWFQCNHTLTLLVPFHQFFAELGTTITRQPIQQKSCSNPLKMQEVL